MKLGYLVLVDQPAPAFTLSSRIPRKHHGIWGPLPLTKFLKQAVGELNQHFRLRDCPRETPIHFQKMGSRSSVLLSTSCLRAELKTCLAPCIAGCSQQTYTRQLNAARKFLNGDTALAIQQIDSGMRVAVQARKFERAAVLRDRRQALERISLHLRRFHDWTSQAHFVYPFSSLLDGSNWWLVVVRGIVVDQWNLSPTNSFAEIFSERLKRLEEWSAGTEQQSSLTGPDEFESSRLLCQWFRHFPEEKERQCSLAKARRICQSKLRRKH